MDKLIPVVGTIALLGSALVGGIFFAFSSFVAGNTIAIPSLSAYAKNACLFGAFSTRALLE